MLVPVKEKKRVEVQEKKSVIQVNICESTLFLSTASRSWQGRAWGAGRNPHDTSAITFYNSRRGAC
eukprot:SAG22_NODE_395_length_11139_cov_14.562500_11_plen_66_part_00